MEVDSPCAPNGIFARRNVAYTAGKTPRNVSTMRAACSFACSCEQHRGGGGVGIVVFPTSIFGRKAQELLKVLDYARFHHILRSSNRLADHLANRGALLNPHEVSINVLQSDGADDIQSSQQVLNSTVPPSVSKEAPLPSGAYQPGSVPGADVNLLEFPLNLEFLEAEFFLFAALGYGLDKVAPDLAQGGPPPMGGKKANLDTFTRDIITQFAYQEVDHIRAIKETVPGFSRPLLDLSAKSFANVFNAAFDGSLKPPFDPYANSLNCLIASLTSGLLGVESGQDAVIRTLLYQRSLDKVPPYPYTVAEFTSRLSSLRDSLGHTTIVDEGLIVPHQLGAGGAVTGNVLSGDRYSVSFSRTQAQILSIVYSTGNASMPGGFFPYGGKGRIARSFLRGRHGGEY
eukprot:Gb_15806 [translate_table: standard]